MTTKQTGNVVVNISHDVTMTSQVQLCRSQPGRTEEKMCNSQVVKFKKSSLVIAWMYTRFLNTQRKATTVAQRITESFQKRRNELRKLLIEMKYFR